MEVKNDKSYGYFYLDIDGYLRRQHISKYRLRMDANLQATQLQAYSHNKIQRIDLAVMARICYALGCELSDIVVYNRPSK